MKEVLRSSKVAIQPKVKVPAAHVGPGSQREVSHGRKPPVKQNGVPDAQNTGAHQRAIASRLGLTHGESADAPTNPATAGTEKFAKQTSRKHKHDQKTEHR